MATCIAMGVFRIVISKKKVLSRNIVFAVGMFLAFILCIPGLMNRVGVEWRNRTVAICMDYRDMLSLARQSGVDRSLMTSQLKEAGVSGVAVAEFTGKDLQGGALPLQYGSAISYSDTHPELSSFAPDQAVILISNKDTSLPLIRDYLEIKYKGIKELDLRGGRTGFVFPISTEDLADSALVPDFRALDFSAKSGLTALFRPAPSAGTSSEQVALSLRWLVAQYSNIAAVIPAGLIVVGYPDIVPITTAIKDLGLSVAQVEFIRQIGIDSFNKKVSPSLLPLHSLVKEEMFSKKMSRGQVVDRMVRAVHERSIRIIFMRPYELYTGNKLPAFLEDLHSLTAALESRGYSLGWPMPFPLWPRQLLSAWSLAGVFLLCFWSYCRRFYSKESDTIAAESVSLKELMLLAAVFLLLGGLVGRVPFFARLMGGFAAAFAATEASLLALDSPKKLRWSLIGGLLIVLAGGLSIASFYGIQPYMIRLTPFSGVKLTLLLPPLLLLLHDFKNRIHPESIKEILQRPPLWAELALCAALLLGAVILAVRSDNASFVPEWEIRFRELLERLLWIRPRTKEFLIGYPSLVLYLAFVRRGLAVHYREVLRVAATIGFASAVNTFCHFHTLLPISLIRVFNGWWLGLLIGWILVILLDKVLVSSWYKRMGVLFH